MGNAGSSGPHDARAVTAASPATEGRNGRDGSAAPIRGKTSAGDAITVVVGRVDPLIGYGLQYVLGGHEGFRVLDGVLEGVAVDLREDGSLSLLAGGREGAVFASAASRAAPRVVIHSEAAGLVVAPPLSEAGSGVVMLAHEPSLPYGMTLLAAGVSCLAWSVSAQDLLAAIRLTASGGCVLVGDEGRVERPDRRGGSILTKREIQVLRLLSEGSAYGEISHKLGISVETVKKHTRRLLRKLRAGTKRDLIGLPVEWLG